MHFSTIFSVTILAALPFAIAGMRIFERDITDSQVYCGPSQSQHMKLCLGCRLKRLPRIPNLPSLSYSYMNGLNFDEPAYNVACHGNCCAYYISGSNTNPNFDEDLIRSRAASLLGCGDTQKNTINGLQVTPIDGSGVCLSNGNGCGDRFDGASASVTLPAHSHTVLLCFPDDDFE
ncbi:uncharacterized protein PHACADRAFT_188014 [Phanerochaete carnosa HHB-10118-sp]|uniref:Killer toxin Kp4 domain-containing protein n=1 Tax=Phanerochaete carnosa (strain HHB-10118-sp) TaxID=650164 RepID=K5VV34_PHACS|nr:uncharacterized protein PHACADRAFT_188014 [Phanerochaete carnosa HHB-10118-sp]EKM50429.1 hypothetical protein PHACADRAFT_188014 [Phanerochaete carnosa HHB-10118-sp]